MVNVTTRTEAVDEGKGKKGKSRSGVRRVGRVRERERDPLAKDSPSAIRDSLLLDNRHLVLALVDVLWLGVTIRRLGTPLSPDSGVQGPVHDKPASCSPLFSK